jgi:hypothetical protein
MYKGPTTRGQEKQFKEARSIESTRIMTRGIPKKKYLEEKEVPAIYRDRLSQCFDYSKLSALRQKILSPLTDRLEYFATGGGFNFNVVIFDDAGSLVPLEQKVTVKQKKGFTEDFSRRPTKPLILHCALDHINKGEQSGHALFLIYFPEFNELDIVSTYQMEPEEQAAIGQMVGAFIVGRTDIIVNDTMAYVGRYGFSNIQQLESSSVGWCVTWMGYLTLMVSKFPIEFWKLPYGNPRGEELNHDTRLWFYREMYSNIIKNKLLGVEALEVLADVLRSGGGKRKYSRKQKRIQRNKTRRRA